MLHLYQILPTYFILLLPFIMVRCSPRKKHISHEAVQSDNDSFMAVASDDQYVAYVFHSLYPYIYILLQKEQLTIASSWIRGGWCQWLVGYLLCFLCSFLPLLGSIETALPPTQSPTKATSRKKRTVVNHESDDNDAFVPRYDIIWSVSYIIIIHSDDFTHLVLQGIALKRPIKKSLPLPQRIQSLVFGLSLICN